MTDYDHEFGFELRVCRWAEREWPPAGSRADDERVVVARQVGTRRRRWDTVVVETTADKLARRARFGTRALDADLLRVVRHAPEEWAWYRDAVPEPDFPWRYVREAVHRAADRGVVSVRRTGGRIELRRKWAYPEWVDRIVAVENKPDLDASAASALADQIERDVALGLADEVWIATRATGDPVEPVLLENVPVEAGLLAVDDADATANVEWYPRALDADATGTRILDRPAGGEGDLSAARVEYVSPAEKTTRRRVIAERAYERGWRSYVDTMRPDCRHFSLRRDGRTLAPWCGAHGREQSGAECHGGCPAFEPEPPAWRQNGWPVEGGPGQTVQRVLDQRRERHRPSCEE